MTNWQAVDHAQIAYDLLGSIGDLPETGMRALAYSNLAVAQRLGSASPEPEHKPPFIADWSKCSACKKRYAPAYVIEGVCVHCIAKLEPVQSMCIVPDCEFFANIGDLLCGTHHTAILEGTLNE